MGFFSFLGGAAGKTIAEPIDAIGNAFDKIFTSDQERLEAKNVLEKLRQQPHLLQAEMCKLEAQHKSILVAGWRPFIGWVCGFGLAFSFLINPIIQWGSCTFAESGCIAGPEMPLESMITLIMALLGLGGLRTFEKLKGITK